jgi:uncharacterized protein (DUF362 family)
MISIRRGKDIRKNLEAVMAELNFKPGRKVYIKPNLCGRQPVLPGENTSVAVMDALVAILRERGCEVIIGHGALLGDTPYEYTLKAAGFDRYASLPGVRVINLDDLDRTAVEIDDMTFHLPLPFLRQEVDAYVNLAKIKTHMEATISLSLKNQMGLCSKDDRVMMHRINLDKLIASLGAIVRPTLNILEGYPAMENNGPHHGTPVDLDLIAAGSDMVELDSFVSRLLGYRPEEIHHIRWALEKGCGTIFPEQDMDPYRIYEVAGFKRAAKVYHFGRRIRAYPTYSCSRCITAVYQAGRSFKQHPFRYWRVLWQSCFSRKQIHIVFGPVRDLDDPLEGKVICIGTCAGRFAKDRGVACLDKCHPNVEETRRYLAKRIWEP